MARPVHFRPSYRRLGVLRRKLTAPVMALTATATPRVRQDTLDVLSLHLPIRIVGSFDRQNLGWHVERADGHSAKMGVICRLARSEPGAAVIYAGTRRVCRDDPLRSRSARDVGRRVSCWVGTGGTKSDAGGLPDRKDR
jgi:superfamily II DNA helicase RecQ